MVRIAKKENADEGGTLKMSIDDINAAEMIDESE